MEKDQKMVNVVIKKDFFVKSRKDNIKDYFDFISVNSHFNVGSRQRRLRYCIQGKG